VQLLLLSCHVSASLAVAKPKSPSLCLQKCIVCDIQREATFAANVQSLQARQNSLTGLHIPGDCSKDSKYITNRLFLQSIKLLNRLPKSNLSGDNKAVQSSNTDFTSVWKAQSPWRPEQCYKRLSAIRKNA
jgi:hypothetical protein